MSSKGSLGMAVIGCGVRGADCAAAIRRGRYTSLVIVMDADEAAAARVGEAALVPWTTDYQEVLAHPEVEAVYISSPHHLHAEQALAAAAAGKHLVVEKPLAHELESAVRMVRAAREAGVSLSPWLGFRYLPEVVKAKELIDAGALGTLLGAELVHHVSKAPSYFSSGGGLSWRGRWDGAGGGVLINQAIHYLDWLLHLGRLDVDQVSASYATLDTEAEVEDTLVMWMRLENGALATVNVSTCVQGLYRSDQVLNEFRMWGTDGHLSLTPPAQFFSSRLVDGKRPERWHSLAPLPRLRQPNVEFVDRFARAVTRGEEPEIGAAEGLRVQALVEASYRSAREGRPRPVELPEL